MLTIKLKAVEWFDDDRQEFISGEDQVLHLEHSLVSLSKWESKFEKPFLSQEQKTSDEVMYYIRCMILDENVDESVFSMFKQVHIDEINTYINAKMTATTFRELPGQSPGRNNQSIVTSELIYYWMVTLTIPFECQTWHLERLFTLIKVCNEKNKPAKKMSRKDAAAQQRAMNAQRRQQFGSSG